MNELQKESLEKATSFERFETALVIVRVWNWVILVGALALTTGAVFWACFSTIPVTISGQCLVFDPENVIAVRSATSGKVK